MNFAKFLRTSFFIEYDRVTAFGPCTCAYQGVKNVSFTKDFAHAVNGWSFSSSYLRKSVRYSRIYYCALLLVSLALKLSGKLNNIVLLYLLQDVIIYFKYSGCLCTFIFLLCSNITTHIFKFYYVFRLLDPKNLDKKFKLKRMYLMWACRDINEFTWFLDLIVATSKHVSLQI